MADVNQFEGLIGLGGEISSIEELKSRFVALEWIVYQLRERTGGDTDTIENIELTITTEDGGNRGITRRNRDEIEELRNRIDSLPKNNDSKDKYQELQDQITDVKRRNRFLENEVANIFDQINSIKRECSTIKQGVFSVNEQLGSTKRNFRLVEQKTNELEERIDNGA